MTGKERKKAREELKQEKAVRWKESWKTSEAEGHRGNEAVALLLARHGCPPWDTKIPEKHWTPPLQAPLSLDLQGDFKRGKVWKVHSGVGTPGGQWDLPGRHANLCIIHTKWVTIMPKDIQLTCYIWGECYWSINWSTCLACVSGWGMAGSMCISKRKWCDCVFFLIFKCIVIISYIVFVCSI